MSIYFALVGAYMKIGYSTDPVGRSTTITRNGKRPVDVPFDSDVKLVGWIPGDMWRERALHVQHMEARVRGEWFRLDRSVAERHIWDDPRGVDLERMSALSVFACLRHPELTRDQIAGAGIPVLATTT